jgi:hypothetical protein
MDANRIYEQNTGHAKSIKLKTLNEIAKSVCKIYVSNKHCTGFFLKIQNDQKTLYILITSYQLIPLKLDKINNEIEIIQKSENINRKIMLNNNERRIVCLEDKDVTFIEILEKDYLINNVKFLNYDLDCKTNEYGNYIGRAGRLGCNDKGYAYTLLKDIDMKKMEEILAKGGTITVSVKERNAYSTPDTYLFKLNVDGYTKAKSFLK